MIALDPATAHHVLRVLRLDAGAAVELFDGDGHAARASLVSIRPCSARVEALLPTDPEPALHLTLAQCISTADKMDWTIEKAVELGVTAIVPLQSEKAIVRLSSERKAARREHWLRLIRAASAQSGRNRLPRLDPVIALARWLKSAEPASARPDDAGPIGPGPGGGALRVILDPRAPQSLAALLAATDANRPARVQLLCGPESGFSDAEWSQAQAAGWTAAGLGPRVLRTETAGLVALAIVQARWGDLW